MPKIQFYIEVATLTTLLLTFADPAVVPSVPVNTKTKFGPDKLSGIRAIDNYSNL